MKADMRGIEGVVAELMNVPAGYETAIETALGASLQNIVCADDKSAQDAVNILKANRAGTPYVSAACICKRHFE